MNELLAPLLWLVDHAAPAGAAATAGAAAGDGGHNDDGLDAVFRLIGKFQSQGEETNNVFVCTAVFTWGNYLPRQARDKHEERPKQTHKIMH
jgi:hypothetical protein